MTEQTRVPRLLIANRGEIAVRIIRAAKQLGWHTIAIYSEADADAPHVRQADEAVAVGPARAKESYGNINSLIEAGLQTGADYLHPGYGFLAENAHFVAAVEAAGMRWVGPSAQTIKRLSSKLTARDIAHSVGVPVLPGSRGAVDAANALQTARKIGFPLMLKAAGGGGGIGIARVPDESTLESELPALVQRAEQVFGTGEIYLERLLERPRHIEVQIFADSHGHMVHLGERECSVQRRHQKVLEEAPSPSVDSRLRAQMGEAALRLARELDYVNAGTVEFLLGADNSFYFLEMNARIQVEHPVTEMVTGADLVAEQLRVASGEKLSLDSVEPRGHAIEARLYAENPEDKLAPSPGHISELVLPRGEGVRVDHALAEGMAVTPYYDPLLAKIVAWGRDRETALRRLRYALESTRIEGLHTNRGLLIHILAHPAFIAGELSTEFMRDHFGM